MKDLKLARVKLAIDATGFGRTIVNGVDLSMHTTSVAVRASVGEPTRVTIDILADLVEVESEAAVLINELRPTPEPPLEHEWSHPKPGRKQFCTTCRIVRDHAPSACPGPLKTS